MAFFSSGALGVSKLTVCGTEIVCQAHMLVGFIHNRIYYARDHLTGCRLERASGQGRLGKAPRASTSGTASDLPFSSTY